MENKVKVDTSKINKSIEDAKKQHSKNTNKPNVKKINTKKNNVNKTEKETKNSTDIKKPTQTKRENSFTWRPFEEFFKTGKNSHV